MVLTYFDSENNTVGNITADPAFPAEEEHNIGEGVFGVILTVWIIVTNSILIITILMDKIRRRNIFCLHIVNLAVADLLVGVVVVPIMADYMLKGSWKLGEDVCQFWFISDILLCTVSILALLMINSDRFMFLTCHSMFYKSSRYIVCCIMIAIPWAIGIGLVLPLWIVGHETINIPEDDCFPVLHHDFQIASVFVSFFVPAFLAIGMNVAIVMMLMVLRSRLVERPPLEAGDNPHRQILVVCLLSLVFIIMWSPFFVICLLMSVIEYYPPGSLLAFTIWLGYANSGVNPVLWLFFPSVRAGYLSLLCCCRKTRTVNLGPDDTRASMIETKHDVLEMEEVK